MPPLKEPCIETESISDSLTKVYTSKNWNYKDKGFAIKVNDTSFFKAGGRRYNNRKSMSISFFGRDKDSIIYETIFITNLPFSIGCNKIVEPKISQTFAVGSEYSTNDDDVTIDEYYTDTTAVNNKIEITVLDTVNRIVEGHFAISYIYANKRPKRNPFEPYKIRFFNGYFKGVYYE
ncbi:MAG: hypothetical protein K1X68_14040 [Saprospiraceae bacterium]|nr:hypothetical protein [Saprospiraceae bacterium]HMW39952.1 hypothetical protein [Saprospiraceae bacterium]HMX89367.1 hypothetical protein [Saprospiraceae bacterium]HMZ41021.1 hypothetical protein [Saprospiraceae bacterium]HNB31375.1 hypothetical protein [Saprospiraceae bacterium]